MSARLKRMCGKKVGYVWLFVFTFAFLFSGLNVIQANETDEMPAENQNFSIGAGIHDITGPAVGVMMQGYAKEKQVGEGIHQRLRSRAFIIEDPASRKRVVFASVDVGLMHQSVRLTVVEMLRQNGYEEYSLDNVMFSATHTHAGISGFAFYGGSLVEQNFNAIVEGVYQSIIKAHHNVEPGYIEINVGRLLGNSYNRSIDAYMNNPGQERALYEDDVDRQMIALNLKTANGELLGIINWFPLHCVSMHNTNKLISGDNKGYASYLFELEMGTDYSADKTFIAAFAQSNCGDASPNIQGGEKGYYGMDDVKNTQYAGRLQFEKGLELSETARERLAGPLDYRHRYMDFSEIYIDPEYTDGEERRTYPSAMGYSYPAGADCGPYWRPWFREQMTSDRYGLDWTLRSTPYLLFQRIGKRLGLAAHVGIDYPELWEQHYPKPILLAPSQGVISGVPEILPVQIFRIGQLAMVAVPGEVTTMAGRRINHLIKETLDQDGMDNIVVLVGHANDYSGYITTPEEYMIQEYEGAATRFGPWTLDAWKQELDLLAQSLAEGGALDPGLAPPDMKPYVSYSDAGKVERDGLPRGTEFGDLAQDVKSAYSPGETVAVVFWSGHPNNDLRTQDSYLRVERLQGSRWVTVASDWDWDTTFRWRRKSNRQATSQVIITWCIPEDAQPGTYRIVHQGAFKQDNRISPYTGVSGSFEVQ